MKKAFILIIAAYFTVLLQGCLTVETKEYSFKLKDGSSGSGSIRYINIMRSEDSSSTMESDYELLISDYLRGSKPESDYSGMKNVKKRLFEEDNRLCAEITFDFDDISKLRFYNYEKKVWSYYISAASGMFGGDEVYFTSNGTFAGENFPVIFWDNSQKVFEIKTTSTAPGESTKSMLDIWKQKGEEGK